MTLAWTLFLIYMLGTLYLGWLGFRRTRNFGSFAIGSGDLHPAVVGITMAASVASAATFIINPGFVYVHGLAGFMHLGISVGIGFCLMLVLLSFRFRQMGEANKALTMPHWIANHYRARNFGIYFAVVNLFALAFVVLIVGGLSIVMQQLLGLSNTVSLIIILTFVTGYVFMGGTYAHVFTNTLQGSLMLIVTLLILTSGLKYLFGDPGMFARLGSIDPNLVKWINPESSLFNDVFSIYISGFLIGAALVCQPHILTKALYLRSDQAVRQYLVYGVIILLLFFTLPLAGFFARLGVPADQLVDAATGAFRQDLVMTLYVKNAFPDWLFTAVGVVLLAAGMSTLDGILVSLSTITANDLILPLVEKAGDADRSEEERLAIAYKASHIVLVAIAVIAFVICLDPPRLLGIFGQVGVYGMAVAAVPPLLLGIGFRNIPLRLAAGASLLGLLTHFALYFYGSTLFPGSSLTFANPGVTASLALIVSLVPGLGIGWILQREGAES
ncbi:MAG: hypothetical protein KDI06_02390 [Calditrichaeota bacterium]|nr:hypothetical protein [Calditrichota bacterium]